MADLRRARSKILFQTVCDGFTELFPVTIDGRNETDETECEQWPKRNRYTRCNGFWNSFDGVDEIDCDPSPLLNCPPNHHVCVSLHTKTFMCLPIAKANDGQIDCIGAMDEPHLFRSSGLELKEETFYCNSTSSSGTLVQNRAICDRYAHCVGKEDEVFCQENKDTGYFYGICKEVFISIRSDVEKTICERPSDWDKQLVIHFALSGDRNSKKRNQNMILPGDLTSGPTRRAPHRCHRGLVLRVWLTSTGTSYETTCLCPPSFYGDHCQYQNQRVSLTLRVQVPPESLRTLFIFIVSLIDDSERRTIHSSHKLTYLSTQDCQTKFNTYFTYATRPKNDSLRYSVHVDIYEQLSLTYRGSLSIPMAFQFLPVHRLAVRIDIPRNSERIGSCSDNHCANGRCTAYANDGENSNFCQCNRGWTGKHCTIPICLHMFAGLVVYRCSR